MRLFATSIELSGALEATHRPCRKLSMDTSNRRGWVDTSRSNPNARRESRKTPSWEEAVRLKRALVVSLRQARHKAGPGLPGPRESSVPGSCNARMTGVSGLLFRRTLPSRAARILGTLCARQRRSSHHARARFRVQSPPPGRALGG